MPHRKFKGQKGYYHFIYEHINKGRMLDVAEAKRRKGMKARVYHNKRTDMYELWIQ